jgi:hypothetical protein
MEEALLDTLLDAQTQGLQTDNGPFKTAGWNVVLEAIKACTTQVITVQQVKSKYCTLKQDWEAWKAFIDHTGGGTLRMEFQLKFSRLSPRKVPRQPYSARDRCSTAPSRQVRVL